MTTKTKPQTTPDPLDVANVAAELAATMDAARTASMSPEMHPYASADFTEAVAEIEQYGRFNTTEGDDLARFQFSYVHTVEQDARRLMADTRKQFPSALDKVRDTLKELCNDKENVIRRATFAFGADPTEEPDAPQLVFLAVPTDSWAYNVKHWSVVAVVYWPNVYNRTDWYKVRDLTGLTRDEAQAELAKGNEPLQRCVDLNTSPAPGTFHKPGYMGYAATFRDYDDGEAAAIACTRAIATIRAASATRAGDEEGTGGIEHPAPTYQRRTVPAI